MLARMLVRMTHDEALAFWFGRINYEQRTPRPGDLKLDRMRTLAARLGNPQDRLRLIHVAGSKGKGSVSAMLAAILRKAGYRTGLFTSPHLVQVDERIQVDSTPIDREALTALMGEVQAASVGLEPTFFEIATALGFLYFVRRRVDVAMIEVGLGGRFDSTNICLPLVSIITSISLDHTQQLGDRLASIAMEKAGIIKPERPVVSGATGPEASETIAAIARARRAPLWQLGVDFHYRYQPSQVSAEAAAPNLLPSEKPRVRITTNHTWPTLKLGLLGEHQAANAAVTVCCVEQLRRLGLSISDEATGAGLEDVHWPARLEIRGRRPLVLLDCAHNVASAQALIDALTTSFAAFFQPRARRFLIFAGSGDKDLPGILGVLAAHFTHVYFTRYAHSSRSVPPDQLGDILRRGSSVPFTSMPTASEALQAARAAAGPEDLICVTGSVFLAGELRGSPGTQQVT